MNKIINPERARVTLNPQETQRLVDKQRGLFQLRPEYKSDPTYLGSWGREDYFEGL